MLTIPVAASQSYSVLLGSGLLSRLDTLLSFRPQKAAIVADSAVYALYGETAAAALRRMGCTVSLFCHPTGEESKSLALYGELLCFLSEQHLTRSDMIFTLGGGVTGDLGGFAAATYLRGVPYVQLPTTLLAAVDASVGGKTAINLPGGKNQAGCFYQPAAVVCDTDCFQTLSPRQQRSGAAEIVKCALLGDEALFSLLEAGADPASEAVLARCIRLKAGFVQADELDRGQRQLLNLGHTFGHAVEQCSGYALTHGEAVSVGIAMMLRAAAKRGLCENAACLQALALLQRLNLPVSTELSDEAILSAALGDKKRRGDMVKLAVPHGIGRCELLPVPVSELGEWIRDGREAEPC